MKHLLWLAILLALPAAGQTINPSQIRPCAANGDVLATEGGVTSCASVVAGNGFINVNTYPGSDLGAQFNAAQTANPGAHNFVITGTGVISTAITINSGSNLYIYAPITSVSNVITLANNNAVICSGPTAPITVTTANNLFTNGTNAANDVSILNCYATFSGSGLGATFFLQGSGSMANLTIRGNNINGANGYFQSSTGAISNSLFDGNIMNGGGNSSGTGGASFGINFNSEAAATNNVTSSNIFSHIGNGWEDAGYDASTSPSLATIIAANHNHNIAIGNTCIDVVACAWTDGVYLDLIEGNTSNGCSDLCFDMEGSASTSIVGNNATNCSNFCMSEFYTAYSNKMVGNTITQNANTMLAIKNLSANPASSNDLLVSGNEFLCTSATTMCTLYLEASNMTTISGNHMVNTQLGPNGEAESFRVVSNDFRFTFAPSSATPGLTIPTGLNGYVTIVTDNSVISEVIWPAGSYCIQANHGDANSYDSYYIQRNSCGSDGGGAGIPFPLGVSFVNNSPNIGADVYFTDNYGLASAVLAVSGTNANTTVYQTGNCTNVPAHPGAPTCPVNIRSGTIAGLTSFAMSGTQAITSFQGTSGTKLAATNGSFTAGNLRCTENDATGDEVDCGVAPPFSTELGTITGGSGTGAVTCLIAFCSNLRGSFSVAGGTFTTGTFLALLWPSTPTAYICTVWQNGGATYYGFGHPVATTGGINITNAVSIAGVTVTVDYSCQP